jgi:hypothetical protein
MEGGIHESVVVKGRPQGEAGSRRGCLVSRTRHGENQSSPSGPSPPFLGRIPARGPTSKRSMKPGQGLRGSNHGTATEFMRTGVHEREHACKARKEGKGDVELNTLLPTNARAL